MDPAAKLVMGWCHLGETCGWMTQFEAGGKSAEALLLSIPSVPGVDEQEVEFHWITQATIERNDEDEI